MSIDNIFKCCKKNYLITGVSGIFLGAYGSYYGLSNFLGPIYEPPVEVPPSEPINDSPPVTDPISDPLVVPLGAPITLGTIVSNSTATIGAVALIGGLAVLSFGVSRLLMSHDTYQTIQLVRENNRLRQEGNLNTENIKRLRNDLRNINNNPKPPRREDFEKIEDNVNIDEKMKEFEKQQREIDEARKNLEKKYNEYLEVTKKDKFSFFGSNKSALFLKGDNFEFEGEKDKIVEKPQELEKIDQASNQLLAKLEGNAKVFVETPLFKVYVENIPGLEEGLIIEGSQEVALQGVILEGIFSALGFKENVSIEAMLTESVQDIQTNMAMNLATTAYDDLNNFIYYGALQVVGTPIVNFDNPNEIVYRFSNMNIIKLPEDKITYLNAPKALTRFKFENTNFVSRLAMQFKIYIIPIFSSIVAKGIGRFNPLLAKWLYVVSNNKFSSSVIFKTVPKINSASFKNQFVKNLDSLETPKNSLGDWKSQTELTYFKEMVFQETGRDDLGYENIKDIPVIKERVEEIYKKLIDDFLQKRNAFVDFIKIYNRLYEYMFPNEYKQEIDNFKKDLKKNVEALELHERTLKTKGFFVNN